MAYVDKLIEAAQRFPGHTIHVTAGEQVALVSGVDRRPMSNQALAAGQVTALLQEILPDDQRAAFAVEICAKVARRFAVCPCAARRPALTPTPPAHQLRRQHHPKRPSLCHPLTKGLKKATQRATQLRPGPIP